jgi:hypothetical protein
MGNVERLGLRFKASETNLFMAKVTLAVVDRFVGRMCERYKTRCA